MRRLLVIAAFLLASCSSSTTPSPSPSPTESPVTTPSACVLPTDVDSHVYNPDRLLVLDHVDPCKTVTGTIDFIRHEADGDYHIGLKVDSQYVNLLNQCNTTCLGGAEHGDLVVEPVCMNTPTQSDAVGSCVGYKNPLTIPPISTHVEIYGAYVLDQTHGWTEIHPLVSIKQIP